MKQVIAGLFCAVVFTACQTNKEVVTDFDRLPWDIQRAVRHEIGNAEIVAVTPTTVAGDRGRYQIDYISEGQRKSLKITETGSFISKSDWGYVVEEAAGAERINPR